MAASSVAVERKQSAGWLRSPLWDLTFISLSVVLVALPYGSYTAMVAAGVGAALAASVVDIVVTVLIGGPHMYATFTRTFADPAFRADHRRFVLSSVLIPVVVLVLGLNRATFPILLTLFFFWASLHVLHQIVFLVECYDRTMPRRLSLFDRAIDYAVVFTSLYPLASARLVEGSFIVSGIQLPFPPFLQHQWVVWLAFLAFFVSLAAWLAKTAVEIKDGRAHYPKLLLIALTVTVAFFLPGSARLDSAFQGFNTWHSFQYLGLTWYANRLAQQRQHAQTPFVARLSGPRDGWRYYAVLVLATLGAGALIGTLLLLREPLGLSPEQPYYIVILSFLLIHYYHDHLLFTKPEDIVAQG